MTIPGITNLESNPGPYPVVLLPGMTIRVLIDGNYDGVLTIHEYPISGSGTVQGMDYIEP